MNYARENQLLSRRFPLFTSIESNEKLYYKILKQIQSRILDSSLSPGDKLPPERQMATSLGVSRPALKQALSILEAMNIIECRQGDGNYILPFHNKLFNPILLDFFSSQGTYEDILEVRYMIEVQTSKILAQKITNEQLHTLYDIVEQMKGVDLLESRIQLNNLFHSTLIHFSGNPLLTGFYDNMLDLISMQIAYTDGKRFYNSHFEIVKSLESRDPNAVAHIMSQHFSNKFPNYPYYEAL